MLNNTKSRSRNVIKSRDNNNNNDNNNNDRYFYSGKGIIIIGILSFWVIRRIFDQRTNIGITLSPPPPSTTTTRSSSTTTSMNNKDIGHYYELNNNKYTIRIIDHETLNKYKAYNNDYSNQNNNNNNNSNVGIHKQQQRFFTLQHLSTPQPGIVPLFDWEIASMTDNITARVCSPPPNSNIPSSCCLGSSSGGGHLTYNPAICLRNISYHYMVGNYTVSYLNQTLPRPYQSTTTTSTVNNNDDKTKNDVSSSNYKFPKQECDICRIIDYLIAYNWTMAIQGDAVGRHNFNALECELRRRGIYEVTTEQHNPILGPYGWRYGIKDIQTLTISLDGATPLERIALKTLPPTYKRYATINFYAIYRPGLDNLEIDEEIVKNNDIVLFDHGSMFPTWEEGDYLDAMTTLLRAYKRNRTSIDKYYDHITHPHQVNNKTLVYPTDTSTTISNHHHHLQLVAWRQTPASHFNTSSGYYTDATFNGPCVPHRNDNNDDKDGYLLRLLKQAATKANFTVLNVLDPDFTTSTTSTTTTSAKQNDELIILPFRDYTSPLYYLHSGDCGGYCNDPYLWLPIWRTLRLAMDRTVRLLD